MGKCLCKNQGIVKMTDYQIEEGLFQKKKTTQSVQPKAKSRNRAVITNKVSKGRQNQKTSDAENECSSVVQVETKDLFPSYEEFETNYLKGRRDYIDKRKTIGKKEGDLIVVIYGPPKTGKTTFIHKMIKKKKTHSTKHSSNLADEIVLYKAIYKEKICKIIFDVPKKEPKMSVVQGDCYFIFFDLSSCLSFYEATKIIQNNLKNFSEAIYLVGNKCDLEDIREISKEKIKRFCRNMKCNYFEISSKKEIGLLELMKSVLETFEYIFFNDYIKM